MATRTIPKRDEVTCDVCGVLCTDEHGNAKANRRQSGQFYIKQAALDYLNQPVACGDIKFDLCDTCLNKLIKKLNEEISSIRLATPAGA